MEDASPGFWSSEVHHCAACRVDMSPREDNMSNFSADMFLWTVRRWWLLRVTWTAVDTSVAVGELSAHAESTWLARVQVETRWIVDEPRQISMQGRFVCRKRWSSTCRRARGDYGADNSFHCQTAEVTRLTRPLWSRSCDSNYKHLSK